MYIEKEQRDRVAPVPYLLVAPTPAEQHVLARDKRDHRIAGFLLLGAFASLFMVAALFAQFGDQRNGVHIALLLFSLVIPVVAFFWTAFHIGTRASTLLARMEKDDRAFELRWQGLLGYGDVGNSLMRNVLFTGDRKISLGHMREVIRDLDPALLDQFLVQPANVKILRQLANASTIAERDAWRKLLEPELRSVLAAMRSDVDHFRAVEARQRKIDKLDNAREAADGVARVRQFECSAAGV